MAKYSIINFLIIIAVVAALVFFGFSFLKMDEAFRQNLGSFPAPLPVDNLKRGGGSGTGSFSPAADSPAPRDNNEYNRLTGEIDDFKKALARKDNDLGDLKKELEKFKDRYLEVITARETLLKEKKELSDKLGDTENELSSLRLQSEQLKIAADETAALKKELDDYRENLDKIADLYERLKLKAKETDAALGRREEENRRKESQIAALGGEVSLLKTQINQLNGYLLQYKEARKVIREKLDALNDWDSKIQGGSEQKVFRRTPDFSQGNPVRGIPAVAPLDTGNTTGGDRPVSAEGKNEAEELKKKVEVILQSVE